ncbi:MAG: cytochrome C [Burkholderiales bacterium]|nr:cytochrome C [Burkholderiales bacterium]
MWLVRLRVLVAGLIPAAMGLAAALLPAAQVNAEMTDQDCLGCHGTAGFSAAGADGKDRPLHVPPGPFARSVHGKLGCAMCHADVTAVPHELKNRAKVDCGSCHAEQKEQYAASVHAKEIEKGNPKAATCARCHSTHAVVSPKSDEGKLAIIEQCGSCHRQNFESYTDTYHGKVTALGFTYTAKCFDCHGSHSILRVADPKSTVHPDRRLATCQKCHAGATTGFVSFQPHANAHDFERYPQVWLAAKSMAALLAGVFLFFWTHTALWFYREFRDRQARKSRPHVATDELPNLQGKQFQRFGPIWRLAHLVFALSVMTLVLTGMAVHFADTAGARAVIDAFGSPKAAALAHRAAAAIMLGIFFLHVLYLVARIGGNLGSFRIFGPTSMMPNWRDLKDIVAMFQWFFGMRPRPMFDRWTYWEKFDYWAVFWGMAIIGGSGAMLAFPAATASVLPGWTFNVATIIHGHEAILAAVFLFTVHFFNNHFRPDKFPLDIVMFTGAVPLEEFRREHALEYERLVQSGELQRHLVDAPSRPMTLASKALGFALIAIGLALLVAVLSGWMGLATVR